MDEPQILPLSLATLTLPAWHPEGPGACPVLAFAVRDGTDVFLVDTGVVVGNPLIERLYKPVLTPLDTALASHDILLGDVVAIVNSHLHFDHCGGNALFPGVPAYVQSAELEAAQASDYTIPEAIAFPGARYVPIDGDHALSASVTITSSPGHTSGHQSVVVETSRGSALIVAQAAYSAAEFSAARAGTPPAAPGSWDEDRYCESRASLLHRAPRRAYFSHDATVWDAAGERPSRAS